MSKSDSPLLSRRALNRALLARQMLVAREQVAPAQALERLAGMQAQGPRGPFVGLWSRLEAFQADDLRRLIDSRQAARSTFLRGTLHLTTADDYLRFRKSLDGLVDGARAVLGDRAEGLDAAALVDAGRAFFAKGPAPFEALREVFGTGDGEGDVRAKAYLVRILLPLVQAPGEQPWRYPSGGDFTLAADWLGREPDAEARLQDLARRYLAAFGPATAADAQVWSGLKGMREAVESLRGELVVFRDEKKRELFDLPDAPRPDEDTPAPVRLLPEFDNILLSHVDRTRVISDAARKRVISKNLLVAPTVLVDGEVAGTWKSEKKRGTGRIVLELFAPVEATTRLALEAEATRLVEFVEPEAKGYEVVIGEED